MRCRRCWNLLPCCTCARQDVPHPDRYKCECCHEYKVEAKKPGIGYVCDWCFTEENGY